MSDGSLQALADGVFAYVQPDGGWCVNNAGVIAGPETTVVIDTAATERRSRRLKAAVHEIAPGGANILVNTHFHGDHVFGNAQFAPGAVIVAHERCRPEMLEAGLGLTNLWPDVEWGDVKITPPVLTFDERIAIHNGQRRIELIHVGPAHTSNDIIIWVPDERILFAGDVVMSGVTPFCLMGSIAGSLRTIERLRALDPVVIVAGHGAIGGPELLDANESYLRWIQEIAQADRPVADLARGADLGDFAKLLDAERLVGNLHRAQAELRGAAGVDILKAFQDMVAFHGRLPDCHA